MNNKFSLTDKLTEIDGKFLDECYERRSRRAIRRKNIVKYSSLAASVVIVITISLVATLPMFRNTPAVDPVDTSSGVVETSPGETEGDKEIGGFSTCEVHHQSYHSIPYDLVEYIGEDEFLKWTELEDKFEPLDGCYSNKTIYNCIHYFDVPREVLEKIYFDTLWHSCMWNIDALYSKDVSESDEFYRHTDEISTVMYKRAALSTLKSRIADNHWEEWSVVHENRYPLAKHSMKYIVEFLDISREEVEEYISKINFDATYDYDLDTLYALIDGTITIDNPTPTAEDALFCGFEDLYIE